MSAEECLKEGNLTGALTQLQDQIRKDPADAKLRIFLFQLLSVMGQWDRAMTQLNLSAEIDPAALAMAQTYGEALTCEVLRRDVFAGKKTPLVFGDPEQWIALLLESLKVAGTGEYAKAAELRDQAYEEAPATAGSVNGEPFEWIADADSRLGPVLEAVVNARYYWIPFHRIKILVVEEPNDLRDRVWMPAYFTWANGGETVGLIPNRYPGSEDSDDGLISLARRTDWREEPGDTFIGAGQRMLATDSGEYALMDIRTIELMTGTEEEAQEGAEGGTAAEPGDVGAAPPETTTEGSDG